MNTQRKNSNMVKFETRTNDFHTKLKYMNRETRFSV